MIEGQAHTIADDGKQLHWTLLAGIGSASFMPAIPYFLARWSAQRSAWSWSVPFPPSSRLLSLELAKFVLLSLVTAWAGGRLVLRAGMPIRLLRRSPSGRRFAYAAGVGIVATLMSTLVLRFFAPTVHARYVHVLGNASAIRVALFMAGIAPFCAAIEIWFRWGLLSAVVCMLEALRVPRRVSFAAANLVAALPAGASVAVQLGLRGPSVVIALAAMAIPSLCYGVMFRREGIGVAMVAHASSVLVQIASAVCT
jgi:hypothetical protein